MKEIIGKVQCADKHLFVRGARGFGKTLLLEQLGRELEKSGRTVLIALNTEDLDAWHKSGMPNKPEFLLVDEVQARFDSPAVAHFAGKSILPELLDTYTIFAGIPSMEGSSSILRHRLGVTDLLVTEEELLQENAIKFFLSKLKKDTAALESKEAEPVGQREGAVNLALRFALHYTSGHIYPCLKLSEFFVEHLSATEMSEQAILELLASDAFYGTGASDSPTAVFQDIVERCFTQLKADPEKIVKRCYRGLREHTTLNDMGLWVENWLLSPLLHLVLLKLAPVPQPDKPKFVAADQIGIILSYCCSQLTWANLFQTDYASMNEDERTRCEDGVSFYVGCHLVTLCHSVSFQHNVLPHGVKKAGRPPSVDFYLDANVDMYLELTKNGSKLEEHFDRFVKPGGKYAAGKKKFAVLDIDFKSDLPQQLSPELEEYSAFFFTFIVRTGRLYDGTGKIVAWK